MVKDMARRICGECMNWRPDDKRTVFEYTTFQDKKRTRSVHMGGCKAREGRFERCQFADECPHFVYDKKRSVAGFPAYQAGESISKAKAKPQKVECVTTGQVFPTIKMAALSVGIKESTLRSALRYAGSVDRIVTRGGMRFRAVEE